MIVERSLSELVSVLVFSRLFSLVRRVLSEERETQAKDHVAFEDDPVVAEAALTSSSLSEHRNALRTLVRWSYQGSAALYVRPRS